MSSEADARILIDRLLEAAGWHITNKAQVSTEEAVSDGRADYLLKDSRTRPLAVLEAKRFAVDPYTAKEQAKDYALSLGAPFVILSNGQEHYYWDYACGDARPIMGFPSQADLERRANAKLHLKGDIKQSLELQPLPHRFAFKGEEVEARPYQLECMQKADAALIAGRRRMLFEMATGTGKTLTIAMLMKRWLQAAVISRVLFLVDRIELAKQAKETFDEYLRDWPTVILYGGKRSLEGQIVVGTLDTIATQLGGNGFGHAYFDLVVTDECHRSIYNTHRATLGHFDAIHIGLTATPNPGELHFISEHERRLVRSTYIFFDCWDAARKEGRPTFEYGIQRGINEGYLTKYRVYHAESVLTYEGAEWEGEEIKPGAWGREVESEDRLKTIIQEYYAADTDRAKEHPRKTIVFAVSEKQASVLVRLFNKLLTDEDCLRIAGQVNRSPSQVRQDFAKKITCYTNNGNPKPVIDQFKYDPLPLVAISVDMLDTGYDQKNIENLIMLRPTKSPIKYAQMRGRGSRLCPKIGKEEFIIYDFVGNSKRFNDPGEAYQKPKLVGIAPGARAAKTGEVEEDDTQPPQPVTQYPEGGSREFLEEMDHEQQEARNGNYRSLFGNHQGGSEELDYDPLRWSVLTSNPDNEAMPHGFDRCPMVQRDSICGSEDKWDEIQFDYILENPPFSGSRGDAKRSLRIEKGDKYVLFLAHALRSLRPGGTAGIIFPNGILFGDTGSHITVKERLLKEFDLQAVVILPKGMFEPYTPNPTCFFIFRNTGKPTKDVWFFKVDGDGSSLSKARKFGSQYRNDLPDLLRMWPGREAEENRAWQVPRQRIVDNGYNMTLSGLGLIEAETVEHPEPEEILVSVAAREERILQLIQQESVKLEDDLKIFTAALLAKAFRGEL